MNLDRTSGLVQDWLLKLGACAMTAFVFLGAFRYAGAHVWSPAAPLQPALIEPAGTGASASPTARAAGLALPLISVPSDIPASTRAPTTRTRQS